jgi:hypothetical protein
VGPPVVPSNAVYLGAWQLSSTCDAIQGRHALDASRLDHSYSCTVIRSAVDLCYQYRTDIAWPSRLLHSFYNTFATQLLFDLPCLIDAMDDNENVCRPSLLMQCMLMSFSLSPICLNRSASHRRRQREDSTRSLPLLTMREMAPCYRHQHNTMVTRDKHLIVRLIIW